LSSIAHVLDRLLPFISDLNYPIRVLITDDISYRSHSIFIHIRQVTVNANNRSITRWSHSALDRLLKISTHSLLEITTDVGRYITIQSGGDPLPSLRVAGVDQFIGEDAGQFF